MAQITDQNYLRGEQYRKPDNLQARIRLHRLYSQNPYPWFRWQWERIEPQPGMHVLEVGCGAGDLWHENLDRLPEGVSVTLGDLSAGMARQAWAAADRRAEFQALALDAQNLPFPDATFDRVIANHMLYHLPDVARGVRELRRVLKPGGRLSAATNGDPHLSEMTALIRRFHPQYAGSSGVERFALENAADVLGETFQQVTVLRYEDGLRVTEAEPLVEYILSMWGVLPAGNEISPDEVESVVRAALVEGGGSFWITKSVGVAIAE